MAENFGVDCIDASMCNRMHRSRLYYNDSAQTLTNEAREDELPEVLMSQLESFIGDGQGRLTVSGAMSSNHEYHKAESFVSVSVACNNDMGDIEQVHDIVRPFVHELIQKDHGEMSLLRDTVLPPEKRLHGMEASPSVNKSSPKGLPPTVVESKGKVGRPPKRGAKVSPPKGARPKPSLKR